MITRSFESRPLPSPLVDAVVVRLEHAHRRDPFSALEPRAVVRRVAHIVADLGVATTVYRGGLDLQGAEIDHLWLAASPRIPGEPVVIDIAFPLFADPFVETLRRFVAGDATAAELERASAGAGVRQRVLGLFPEPLRYLGAPVWSARRS